MFQVNEGEPAVIWLSGLHIPESYLTALVQATCRKNGWPLDKSTLYTAVTHFYTAEELTERAHSGNTRQIRAALRPPLATTRVVGCNPVDFDDKRPACFHGRRIDRRTDSSRTRRRARSRSRLPVADAVYCLICVHKAPVINLLQDNF